MAAFTVPTAEDVRRYVRILGHAEAAVGIEMSPTAGHTHHKLRNLPVVADFLQSIDEIGPDERKASIHYVNPNGLASWVRDTVGDAELGDALAAIAADGRPYGVQVYDLKDILVARLLQYRDALKAEGPAA